MGIDLRTQGREVMEKRKHITRIQRARQFASRMNALQKAASYERKMRRLRHSSVVASLDALVERKVPPVAWASEVEYSEPWMYPLLKDMYLTIGYSGAVEVANRLLSRKADVTDAFAQALLQWAQDNLGDRIVLMGDTVAKFLKETITRIYLSTDEFGNPASTQGVEELTRRMYRETLAKYDAVQKWQVRRICHTEAMKSLNIGGRSAADALGIPYEKTWSISGINTRETHAAVDGITIDQSEMFNVGGFLMQEPMDERFGAPASEVINCACTVIYLPKGNGITEI